MQCGDLGLKGFYHSLILQKVVVVQEKSWEGFTIFFIGRVHEKGGSREPREPPWPLA